MMTLESLNPRVLKAEYAVRGPIVELAQNLEKQGREMYYFNIGNPQALGQSPISYYRDILSLVINPKLLRNNTITSVYQSDIVKQAQLIMKNNPIGLGAYSLSAGMMFVRQAVADFITKRDNIPATKEDIYLTDGASKGVDLILQSFIRSTNDGVMIPIPQYPLYSADITLFGGKQVPYYLDEEKEWSMNEAILEESMQQAVKGGITPRVIVVINPNNPTGSLLSYDNIAMVLAFAEKYDLAVIADEVYQENVYYSEDKFHSFAKVAHEKGIEVALFSLHSTSKGFIGECGFRGGYLEIRNSSKTIKEQLLKVRSIGLCSNTPGQMMTYLMVSPPEQGSDSYNLYNTERNGILESLKRKSQLIADSLDKIDGITCPRPRGAMYLFPKLDLSTDKDYQGKEADFRFCEHLVTDAGIVTVPGSGFGQMPGTYHLRMTFLPPEEKIAGIMSTFEASYKKFLG